ncbi:MAG: glycine cleavage system protein T, partial [Woeseiaceae bacterium]|nr:glycine cleavage system protein T [Woeseiaceae bacterium]
MSTVPMILSRRLRKSPYERRAIEHGASLFSLYNKMTLPMVYESYEKSYEHLCEHVQLWDVACQRQVELFGPDALNLAQLLTPRDLSDCIVGQGLYVP